MFYKLQWIEIDNDNDNDNDKIFVLSGIFSLMLIINSLYMALYDTVHTVPYF